MKQIQAIRNRFFPKPNILPSGFFAFQSPPEASRPYRMHLRLEKDGTGVLVVNAQTVLHLNQTAAELAYHIVNYDSVEVSAREIAKRYNVPEAKALEDAIDFQERIHSLIDTPDLDPVMFLDFNRVDPYSTEISAPYRLDCALTYQTGDETPNSAPTYRVTRELVTDEWKTILLKAWQVGIPQIVFTGGEPTIRPDLVELISITENQGQVAGLLTNGKRLAEPEYLHRLLDSGLDHVMIVLDPESTQAWEAIRDVSKEDLFMTVHLTLTHQNVHKVIDILKKLLVIMDDTRSLSLSAEHPDLSTELASVRDQAILMGFNLVWDLPVPYSALNPVSVEMENGNVTPKGEGNAWLYVEPDGDVLPDQGVKKMLGNILKDEWATIWQNCGH
ncbi:MAG: radical SAM protein [Leptolinea sp.]|nr:radical SAM protein [Leptolinea sp.]